MSQSRSPLRHRWSRSTRQWSSLLTSTTTRRRRSVSCRCQSSSSSSASPENRWANSSTPKGRLSASTSMRWKKRPVLRSPVLGGLDHPPAVGGDEAGDGSHDARPVGTGDGQYESAHGTILRTRFGRALVLPRSSSLPLQHPGRRRRGPGRQKGGGRGEPAASGRAGGGSPRVHCDVTVLLNSSCTNWILRPVHPLPFRPPRVDVPPLTSDPSTVCAPRGLGHDS